METPRKALRTLHMENIVLQSTPLRIPPSPFMKSLGYGTGVNVFKLERSPRSGQMRSPWAVKRMSQKARCAGQIEFNKRIQDEAEILRKLSHPNIVGFRGMNKAADGVDSLALECCSTSLGSLIEDRSDDELGPLPAKQCLKMIIDISKALDYLHDKARILHGDVKSANILVKGDFEICKLCDFGVSLPIGEDGLINLADPGVKYVGTNLWSAPEVIDGEQFIDQKADIFSFGLVIYETIALCPPHTLILDDLCDDTKENNSTFDEDSDMNVLIEGAMGTRPVLPEAFVLTDEYNPVVELFYCCTNEAAEDRPEAKIIWMNLEKS